MTTVSCPDCGNDRDLAVLDRLAECFCPECDYPLFWAPSAGPLGELGDDGGDESLRRLPGAGGRTLLVSLACPACGERNPASDVNCLRCDALLRPEPAPTPAPAPPPRPVPVVAAPPPPPPPPKPFPWFWVLLAISLLVVTIVVLIWLA